mmetsp:Transcript_63935/g.183800  ORF Transcript_63935/g.183800 Transcript_63935/m.183800 type:complete len:379 (+) Transcript_63935:542-1678(+)
MRNSEALTVTTNASAASGITSSSKARRSSSSQSSRKASKMQSPSSCDSSSLEAPPPIKYREEFCNLSLATTAVAMAFCEALRAAATPWAAAETVDVEAAAFAVHSTAPASAAPAFALWSACCAAAAGATRKRRAKSVEKTCKPDAAVRGKDNCSCTGPPSPTSDASSMSSKMRPWLRQVSQAAMMRSRRSTVSDNSIAGSTPPSRSKASEARSCNRTRANLHDSTSCATQSNCSRLCKGCDKCSANKSTFARIAQANDGSAGPATAPPSLRGDSGGSGSDDGAMSMARAPKALPKCRSSPQFPFSALPCAKSRNFSAKEASPTAASSEQTGHRWEATSAAASAEIAVRHFSWQKCKLRMQCRVESVSEMPSKQIGQLR